MQAIYIIYSQSGSLKRGVISETQYSKYSQDPSISNLQVYVNQSSMENAFNEAKGISGSAKRILLG